MTTTVECGEPLQHSTDSGTSKCKEMGEVGRKVDNTGNILIYLGWRAGEGLSRITSDLSIIVLKATHCRGNTHLCEWYKSKWLPRLGLLSWEVWVNAWLFDLSLLPKQEAAAGETFPAAVWKDLDTTSIRYVTMRLSITTCMQTQTFVVLAEGGSWVTR